MAKLMIYLGVTVGSLLGTYLPVWLFGASVLSVASLAGGAIGSIAGIFVGYKAYQYLDE